MLDRINGWTALAVVVAFATVIGMTVKGFSKETIMGASLAAIALASQLKSLFAPKSDTSTPPKGDA